MELIKKQVRMSQLEKIATDQFMIDDYYNVPDAKSDVGRVISGDGKIKVEEVRRVENYLHIAGKLHFKVLYVTDSADPQPAVLDGTIPVEEMVYMDVQDEGDYIVQIVRVECVITQIHSRKLAVKAVAELVVHTEKMMETQTTVDVDTDKNIFRKKHAVELLQLFTKKRDIYRIKEEIKIPGTKENIGTLLWTEVNPRRVDTKLVQDAVIINGELQVFALYESQDGKTDWIEQTISYEGKLDCPGVEETMYHQVYDELNDVSVEVRMDEDGEMRALGIEASLELRLFVYQEEQTEILEDVYSLKEKCSLKMENAVYEELLTQNHSKSKVMERLKLPELKDEILQICHSNGILQLEKMEPTEEGLVTEGILHVSFLYVKANDAVPFAVWKGMIPFYAVLECANSNKKMKYDVTYGVEQLTVDLAGNDEVEIKAVISFRSFMRNPITAQIVTDIQAEPYDKNEILKKPGIVGYIVKEGDDLWNLAKKYLTTEENIILNNEMLSKELKAGEKILIFRENMSIL